MIGEHSALPGVEIPPAWQEAANSIAYDSSSRRPPTSLVCGPGNCGKSTFSLHLLNTLLKRYERVAYLDTDVGQAEFTPPGCISLLIFDNPIPDLSILCLKTPERCVFYGGVSAEHDPNAYLNSIYALYDHFIKEHYHASETDGLRKPMLPLIVNTSGWVKGLGYNLLVEILRFIDLTHVVQFRTSPEKKNLPRGLFWLEKPAKGQANLIEIPQTSDDSSIRFVSMKKEARVMRDLRVVSYFRQCMPRDLDISSYKELVHSFATVHPYELHFSEIGVIGFHYQAPISEPFQSMDKSIVGLGDSSMLPSESENYTNRWCIGLGFVVAIDMTKDLLYLITPVPRTRMKKVDLLLQGSIETPTCLLQVHGCIAASLTSNPSDDNAQMAETTKLLTRLKAT
ncbi:polynucleotide 5'-hydroxyl-kinase GRC3/NOL9 protein [Dioscorea alata]|uniref:Polynucleotide 5'-hydroxyl-kinase GRC3/NOL9 protein n=1 Tax=Dioscorea alata TaxID=55571 RepID=A0ACB7TTW3_DIOAL|nr:polynucleotide 5'-hydroxyl-kinase GRC3/NOL9 protein [Dioscorea alata]